MLQKLPTFKLAKKLFYYFWAYNSKTKPQTKKSYRNNPPLNGPQNPKKTLKIRLGDIWIIWILIYLEKRSQGSPHDRYRHVNIHKPSHYYPLSVGLIILKKYLFVWQEFGQKEFGYIFLKRSCGRFILQIGT